MIEMNISSTYCLDCVSIGWTGIIAMFLLFFVMGVQVGLLFKDRIIEIIERIGKNEKK